MSDRELPEDLKAKLSAELTSGAPLRAPLPSQARFAWAAPVEGERAHAGQRWATAAVAALTLVLIGFVGVPPLLRDLGSHGRDVITPIDGATPTASWTPGATASPVESSPSPTTSPAPVTHATPTPHESPDAHESPDSSSHESGGQSPAPSPGTSTSPDE